MGFAREDEEFRGRVREWLAANVPAGLRALHQAAFGSNPRPTNERDLIPVKPMLVLDSQQRVFLRTADDQAGDDVDDPHALRL